MVVRCEDGKFTTARQCPKMQLIVPALPPGALDSESGAEDGMMLVDAPGMEQLSVPLRAPPSTSSHAWRMVTVWVTNNGSSYFVDVSVQRDDTMGGCM